MFNFLIKVKFNRPTDSTTLKSSSGSDLLQNVTSTMLLEGLTSREVAGHKLVCCCKDFTVQTVSCTFISLFC